MDQLLGAGFADAEGLCKDLSIARHGWESPLLDSLWADDVFQDLDHSQVVPDGIDLDLSGLAAGLEQDCGNTPCVDWAACQDHSSAFGSPFQLLQSHTDVCNSPVSSSSALLDDKPLMVPCDLTLQTPQQQLQPAVLQMVPSPQMQPTCDQEQEDPGFVWPCPERLRCTPSTDSRLTAAAMVPLVFPATPQTTLTAAQPGQASSCYSSELHAHQQEQHQVVQAVVAGSSWLSSNCLPVPSASSEAAEHLPVSTVMPSRQRRNGQSPATASTSVAKCAPFRSRAEAVARYRLKRARRSAVRRVRYQRRKEYADQRPRVGGRFVKASELSGQQQQAE